jgi:hypothetical protein
VRRRSRFGWQSRRWHDRVRDHASAETPPACAQHGQALGDLRRTMLVVAAVLKIVYGFSAIY